MERDLGVLVDEKLNFHIHAQAIIAKSNKTLGLIKKTFTSRSLTVMNKLYKSCLTKARVWNVCCMSNQQD